MQDFLTISPLHILRRANRDSAFMTSHNLLDFPISERGFILQFRREDLQTGSLWAGDEDLFPAGRTMRQDLPAGPIKGPSVRLHGAVHKPLVQPVNSLYR
jgi:hypothetical protein